MLAHALIALCSATAVVAQTTAAGSFLDQFGDDENYQVSTVGSDGTHTTYVVSCADPNANNCGYPPGGATIVNAASAIKMYYDYEDVMVSVGCSLIDSGASAACVMSEGGPGLATLSDAAGYLTSMTVPASAVQLSFSTGAASVSAGLVSTAASAGASVTAGIASATSAAASAASAITGATTLSTAAVTTSKSGSATQTGAAASATSATKTGAAVKGYGNVYMNGAVGAAVLGLGFFL